MAQSTNVQGTVTYAPRPQRGRRASWRTSEALTAYAFLFVPLLLFSVLKFYPLIYNLILSFTRYDLFSPMQFVGLQNYRQVLAEDTTRNAIRNTLLFTLGAVPLGTALALIVAALLNQPFLTGRAFLRTLYYLPVVTATIVVALIWKWIFNPGSGLLNYYLELLGFAGQNWLNDPRLALPSLVVVMIWSSLGANMVIFLAGLQDIPDHLYEAAHLDGAVGWQTFLYVTVPLLRPVILFVVVTFSIAIFRSFGIIFVLTQGGPRQTTNTLVWEVYMNAFAYLNMGKAAAISFVLILIVLLITIVNFRVLREE